MQHNKPVELEVAKPVDSDDEFDVFTPEEIANAKALDEAEKAAQDEVCDEEELEKTQAATVQPEQKKEASKPVEVKTEAAPVANQNVNSASNPEDKPEAPETLRHRAVVLYNQPPVKFKPVEFKNEYYPIVVPNCDQLRMPCATVQSFTVRHSEYKNYILNAALGAALLGYVANKSISQIGTCNDMVIWRNHDHESSLFKMMTSREQKFHAPSRESKNTVLQAFEANLARINAIESMYQVQASAFRSSFFHRPNTQMQQVGRARQPLTPLLEEVDEEALFTVEDTYTPSTCERFFNWLFHAADQFLDQLESSLNANNDVQRPTYKR